MCGIAGVLYFDGTPATEAEIAPMLAVQIHRGPDQGAVIVDGGCGLGNRRLAIQDISPSGALPMRDGDNIIAFNGEVYNHPRLRRLLEMEGARYRSNSDTETVLKLYRRDGQQLLHSLRGMFAFALWDAPNQRLTVARDRLGEKPLYYYHDERVFVFASEIKSLLMHPAVPRESAFDAHLLALYLGYGYIPAPLTAFKGIKALLPGHVITITGRDFQPQQYWTPPHPARYSPLTAEFEARKCDELREALGESVRQALISDVPLGAFLSGGLDSSLIVALMRRHQNGTIRTFSIGFAGDDSFDETQYARQVASRLGTEHTAFTVNPQAFDLAPTLVWHHDQPFADSSAIPTYLVSQLTRQQVTVALTGDGGDELFAGYERFYAHALVQRMAALPRSLWSGVANAIRVLPEGTGYYNVIKRAGRFARGASLPPALAYYDWIRLFNREQIGALTGATSDDAGLHFAAQMGTRVELADLLRINMLTYLPDDLLIKTDRSSMAVSLETRAPFLDHWLVEMAATIPDNLKLKGSTTKYLLKKVAEDLLPAEIIHRPKHGFGVPLGAWLRMDIRHVRDLLLDARARERGLLDTAAVTRLLDEHAAGKRDHGGRLWSLLTLELWHRLFIDAAQPVKP
jgi:asparagine synthase (glutamine-hydrolysing)